MSRARLALLCTACHLSVVCLAATPGQAADRLRTLAAAHVRVVWVQDHSQAANDTQARGRELTLMGYDSDDGKGERRLLEPLGSYARPLLTTDGRRVVYTDRTRQQVLVIDWDGGRPTRLARGMALSVWRDPADGRDWVIFARRQGPAGSYHYRNVNRVRLDDPSLTRAVWSKTRISPDNFQLSRNGRHAAGIFPWPNGGLARLDPPGLSPLGRGCWASLAPDDSRLAWVFDGPHRHLKLVAPDGGRRWKVAVDKITSPGGDEMFHPRWTNHVEYLVLTGPYRRRGPINLISGGGPMVEVHLAKFTPGFDAIAASVRVSKNSRPDFFPDAWIATGSASRVPEAVLKAAPTTATTEKPWPPAPDGLLWGWRNARAPLRLKAASNRPEIVCRLRETGRARPGRYFDLRTAKGSAVAGPAKLGLAEHFNRHGTLTLSALIQLEDHGPKAQGVILAIDQPGQPGALLLVQDDGSLVLEATTSTGIRRVRLGEVLVERPQHITISIGPDRLRGYLQGKSWYRGDQTLAGLQLPEQARLRLGNRAAGDRNCVARIEAVAVFDRALSAAEALQLADAVAPAVATRRPPRPVRLRARVIETSPLPAPLAIAPYRRALVYHHYRVLRVDSGRLSARDILVAHWAVLDGKSQPGGRRRVGREVQLKIEPLEDHPQLDSERQVLDVARLDLPQFVDVTD